VWRTVMVCGDCWITPSSKGKHTMTKREGKAEAVDIKGLLARDGDFVRAGLEVLLQAALEAEMTEEIGAAKGERTETRVSYRSGYYNRSLITRVGTLELRVPQDRLGRFSTDLFARYQRSEKALVGTLAEMYVQGVSTRKVKAVTEALCGHEFSASSISVINKSLDENLKAFAKRRLEESYPYLILDARYEKVREGGVICSQAVQIAVGVDADGRRQILAVELANRERRSSWRDFLSGLKARGLAGVEFVVSDDHEGLKRAIRGGVAGGGLAALLRAFPAQRARLRAAQSGRRLLAGAALDLRPARTGRGAARRGPMACQVAVELCKNL
jgi:putative transposase